MAFLKKLSKVFVVLILIAIAFYLGVSVGESIRPEKPEELDFSLFWETWDVLKDKFVEPSEMVSEEMIYGAISGMVKSLEDPYTIFLDPDETKRFLEDVSGSFEGVGMEIGIRKGQLTIIAPLEGTPAKKAGLRAGDKIIQIDDVFAQDITIDKAVDLIRGQKGTQVTLTVFRDDWNTTKDFSITRGVIEIPSLKLEMLDQGGEPGNDIAYLQLYHFSEKASSDFNKAAREILDSSAKKIILDLRNNPGGYLEVAQDIAGWFLKKGQIVTYEDFGDKKDRKEYKAEGNERLLYYPIVVLINQGSASGSEILAGALRDNRDAKLIGEKSFGKGSVQELSHLSGGSSLKVTVAKWLTPNGDHITGIGLEPDIEVELTEEDYEQELDSQLDKALELIAAME